MANIRTVLKHFTILSSDDDDHSMIKFQEINTNCHICNTPIRVTVPKDMINQEDYILELEKEIDSATRDYVKAREEIRILKRNKNLELNKIKAIINEVQ